MHCTCMVASPLVPKLFTSTYFHKSLTHNLEIVGKRLTVFDLDTVFYSGIMRTGLQSRPF